MNTTLSHFIMRKKGVDSVLHIIVLLLSLLLVVGISIDTFRGIPFYKQSVYMKLQFWICLVFLADFVVEWILADNKKRYFATHFIFLLVSIPYLNIVDYMGWTFSPEVTYLIRFMPLIRGGYAIAIVVGWLTYNRASSLLISYITMLLAIIYFASLAFYVTEHGVNSQVKDYGDSLWWACMDVTTIGSNVIAVTPIGRVLSVLLVALGMMTFPIFTVYLTNLVGRRNKEREAYYKQQEKKKDEASAAKKA